MVVNRQDLQSETARSRIKPDPGLPGMPEPDLIAPLVFDQDTLGVIVLSKPRKSGDPKTALRLVTQTGAQVLHTAAQVSRMKTTAEMDGLTRIYNKKHLEQTLNELIYRVACAAYDQRSAVGLGAPGQVLSVFLFDIDNFKNYNDTNGHLAGDKLLQELAGLVNEAVRKDDIFGRFGGEEFLLIMPHTNAQQALLAAEKIRALLASHSVRLRRQAAAADDQHQRRRRRVSAPRARRRRPAARGGRGALRGEARRQEPVLQASAPLRLQAPLGARRS
jgi:diguanylate cyclase (GGDEF)-like protein